MVKEFLSQKGIAYTEANVQQDAQALEEMVKLSGGRAVPVTTIAGDLIVGFDRPRLQGAADRMKI